MKFRKKTDKIITRGCMRYLELTEFPLIPSFVLKSRLSLSSSLATKCFETLYNGKAMTGD